MIPGRVFAMAVRLVRIRRSPGPVQGLTGSRVRNPVTIHISKAPYASRKRGRGLRRRGLHIRVAHVMQWDMH